MDLFKKYIIPSSAIYYEYDEKPLKYGYWIAEGEYDPSRPGQDKEWVSSWGLFHEVKGEINTEIFDDKRNFDFNKLRFLNKGLISYKNKFFDKELNPLFELPSYVTGFRDFEEDDTIFELYKSYKLLVQVVKGEIYSIVDITGIEFPVEIFKNLRHIVPFIDSYGKDLGGSVKYFSKGRVFPINGKYFLSCRSLEKQGLIEKMCITNQYGDIICSGDFLVDYNEHFYVFNDCVNRKDLVKIYNIYGDLIFEMVDKVYHRPYQNGNINCGIMLQDNGLLVIKTDDGYKFIDYKGRLVLCEKLDQFEDFSCNMAFFVESVDDITRWGFLKYIDGKIVKLYINGNNIAEVKEKGFYYVIYKSYKFCEGIVEVNGIKYDTNLKIVEKEYDKIEAKYEYCKVKTLASNTFVEHEISFYRYKNVKIKLDPYMKLDDYLGNGLFLGHYIKWGKFDIKGNVFFEEEKFPKIYKNNAPNYSKLFSPYNLERIISSNRLKDKLIYPLMD